MAKGDERLVVWLLRQGANPMAINYFGLIPLDVAKNQAIAELFRLAVAELVCSLH